MLETSNRKAKPAAATPATASNYDTSFLASLWCLLRLPRQRTTMSQTTTPSGVCSPKHCAQDVPCMQARVARFGLWTGGLLMFAWVVATIIALAEGRSWTIVALPSLSHLAAAVEVDGDSRPGRARSDHHGLPGQGSSRPSSNRVRVAQRPRGRRAANGVEQHQSPKLVGSASSRADCRTNRSPTHKGIEYPRSMKRSSSPGRVSRPRPFCSSTVFFIETEESENRPLLESENESWMQRKSNKS